MPRGVYERRKIKMSDVTTNGEAEVTPSFLDTLHDSLTLRMQAIKDEINAIDNQMTTMQDNRVSLVDEQNKVQDALNALKVKK